MITNKEKIRVLTALRNNIKNNQYPLCYEDDFQFYNKNPKFNCYAYALGLKTPNRFFGLKWEGVHLYNPGTISSFKMILYDRSSLIEAFLADCDALGFNVSDKNNLEYNSFNVAVYFERWTNFGDFHFIRQNNDGTWSNMKGVGGEVELLTDLNIPFYEHVKTYTLSKERGLYE